MNRAFRIAFLLATVAALMTGWKVGRASRQMEIDDLAGKLDTVRQESSQARDLTDNRRVSELRRTLAKQEEQKLENAVAEIIGLKTRTLVQPLEPVMPAFKVSELDTMSPRSE